MSDPKPKDCTCHFPHVRYATETHHGEWCRSHKRLVISHRAKYEQDEWRRWAEKDAAARESVQGEDWL